MVRDDIKIVVIELQQSVVVRGITNKLKELHFNITQVGNDVREISRHVGMVDLMILYLSDSILDKAGSVNTIVEILDKVNGSEQKLVLIGEKDFLDGADRRIKELYKYDRFLLPIDTDKLGTMVEEVIDREVDGAKKRVLIVDDDPAYAKMVRGWIGDDYNTNIVAGGMHAITFLTQNKVDLILLDYEMPIVDGPQVFEMIKQKEELGDVPIVFLTGNGNRESVQRVMKLGPAGYVLKGASRLELLTKIKNVLSKHN